MREDLKIYITSLKSKDINMPDAKVKTLSWQFWIAHIYLFDKNKEGVEIQDIGEDFFLFCAS